MSVVEVRFRNSLYICCCLSWGSTFSTFHSSVLSKQLGFYSILLQKTVCVSFWNCYWGYFTLSSLVRGRSLPGYLEALVKLCSCSDPENWLSKESFLDIAEATFLPTASYENGGLDEGTLDAFRNAQTFPDCESTSTFRGALKVLYVAELIHNLLISGAIFIPIPRNTVLHEKLVQRIEHSHVVQYVFGSPSSKEKSPRSHCTSFSPIFWSDPVIPASGEFCPESGLDGLCRFWRFWNL